MNIGVADDHAKQRFGLYQNGGDLGGESLEAISWRGRMAGLRARVLLDPNLPINIITLREHIRSQTRAAEMFAGLLTSLGGLGCCSPPSDCMAS